MHIRSSWIHVWSTALTFNHPRASLQPLRSDSTTPWGYFQCDRRCDSSFSQVIGQPLQPSRWILMACGPLESMQLVASACSSFKLHPEGASTPSAGDTACTAPHAPTGQLLSPAHKDNTRMCNAWAHAYMYTHYVIYCESNLYSLRMAGI